MIRKGKLVYARNPAHVFRDAEMALLYREGKTLQEIGDKYGITRERVRQCFARLGLSAACGGETVRALIRVRDRGNAKAKRRATREVRIQAKYGIPLAQWKAMGSWARNAYRSQRTNARKRGIEWKLTLGEWWRIWQDSGHWEERGRGTGYCMARWADDGPYSPENVYICTIGQNFKDSYLVKPAAARALKRKATMEAKNF